ncbi:hypothetical protein B0T18DRAFT_393618 [Schizothecium vesticola]|uniref:Uncharacterized protein n=1 Tax=Schizothecium vesticola TaxID=314040 RepID=A0AA40EKA2_9PEZI|nr:hypothetical protein B0T18DRAFT_393618 [Schizothecium vesticola]
MARLKRRTCLPGLPSSRPSSARSQHRKTMQGREMRDRSARSGNTARLPTADRPQHELEGRVKRDSIPGALDNLMDQSHPMAKGNHEGTARLYADGKPESTKDSRGRLLASLLAAVLCWGGDSGSGMRTVVSRSTTKPRNAAHCRRLPPLSLSDARHNQCSSAAKTASRGKMRNDNGHPRISLTTYFQ